MNCGIEMSSSGGLMDCNFSGKRVLVSGGTGFVGGRLVEKLAVQCNAKVRVLVRDFGKALRIARFPVEMIYGDITSPEDVRRAAGGCEIIFHCAYGNQGDQEQRKRVNMEGTENVIGAALKTGVERVVHLSTVAVYGWKTPRGRLDETARLRYSGEAYSDSKLDAEKAVRNQIKKGLSAAILQPTVIYGPNASPWTLNVLQWLKRERVILVNGGRGLCNPVYIDDLVNAILLAAMKKEISGHFLISGGKPVTWREFFSRHERMLGFSSTIDMTEKEAVSHYARGRKVRGFIAETLSILGGDPLIYNRVRGTREIETLAKVARTILPEKIQQTVRRRISGGNGLNSSGSKNGEKPIQSLSPHMVQFFSSETWVSIEKARRLLNYHPIVDFESGMAMTEKWAGWANLL